MKLRTISFPPKDFPLRDDVRTLGALVGDVVREQAGEDLFRKVEAARSAAIERREHEGSTEALYDAVRDLDPTVATELVRAFLTYFRVVNLVETIHRIRRGRQYLRSDVEPQIGSLEDVVQRLHDEGLSATQAQELFTGLRVEPVFTAHPTQSTRRLILEKQHRIADRLLERLDAERTPREERTALERVRSEVTAAWQTDEHLSDRPSVADEAEHVLYTLTGVLYRVAPAFYEALDDALEDVYGEALPPTPTQILRFASWVGGDMDGNPNVTAATIVSTLERHRALVLDLYIRELEALSRQLTQSLSRVHFDEDIQRRFQVHATIFPGVVGALPSRRRQMPYHILIRLMIARLRASAEDDSRGYPGPAELLTDVYAIENSLIRHGGAHAGAFQTRRLRRRIETFGFHLARLDVRQDAREHREVMAELLRDPEWPTRAPQERTVRLAELLASNGSGAPLPEAEDTGHSAPALAVFGAIGECRARFGPQAVGPFVISMAQGVDDVLTVLFLARRAGLGPRDQPTPLDVAPLLETVPDLERGGQILEELFAHPTYAAHLKSRGDSQTVMVGYSDSNKDGGLAAARWSLQKAQGDLARAADLHNVELTLFHGRGGTVSRGGGKAHRAVLAAPPRSVRGRLRVTEQGEVIDAKYGLASIALRNLEQTAGALARVEGCPTTTDPREQAWAGILERVSRVSRGTYRGLVHNDPGFWGFFREITPIDVIERMTIGSRPASRRAQLGIDDLRAIPWVFSWTQNRAVLPGWFGLGTGLQEARTEFGTEALVEMARGYPFMRTLLEDVEMVLAKADLGITECYLELVSDENRARFELVREEYDRTAREVLVLRETERLLDGDPTLQRAIRLRNPYVDPLSLLQVDLLGRWRAGNRTDDRLLSALLGTINGIAQGLQNTG